MDEVAARFGLGTVADNPVRVTGGLSNEVWRVVTDTGAFAVKRMVLNADRPDFVGNVEASYAVERRAWQAGVRMPEPVPDPDTGRALATVDGSLFRVHRWLDGQPRAGTATDAADLLATIHAAGAPRRAHGMLVVDSHRDLDRKNALLRADGTLAALDWDAAGPIGAVHEAAALALDWSANDPGTFATAIDRYQDRSGLTVPAEPWIFDGWIAAQRGWLDHHRGENGDPEQVRLTLAHLQGLDDNRDDLLAAIGA
ncbi:phosphotransferase [Asanoa sp. WMMD1127]|uniref:phosphotransferase n=1 Tax=Asanoa sp. WMMD1127 TaxID=3016107 RepID=UPI0024166220|nr:phosphotransferase [Asanoa sp. WMMD1127]MDG4824014.1 phosphotransferase [Asanoa sp. WMMD1127]